MPRDYFSNAVNELSIPVRTQREFMQHFKDTYGEKNWKREATAYIAGTRDSKSTAYKSAARNFQGGRDVRPGIGRETAKWRDLGKEFPRQIRKGDSITIHFEGKQKGNRGKKDRDRSWDVTLTGEKAREWVNNPSFDVLWDEIGIELGIEDEAGDIDPDYVLTGVHVSAA